MKRRSSTIKVFTMAFILGLFASIEILAQQGHVIVNTDFEPHTPGFVNVDGVDYPGGTVFYWDIGTYHQVLFNRQPLGAYYRVFHLWHDLYQGTDHYENPFTIRASANAEYTAETYVEYGAFFQNSFPNVGNGGVIKVNGVQYNSPTSRFPVVQGHTITAEPVYQTINDIYYMFSQWSDGNTSMNRTFAPSDNATYTALFVGHPTPVSNFNVGGPVGEHVHLTWSEHPNSNVTQYQIWRRAKDQGFVPQLISTVPRGTTCYTDPDYVNGSGSGSTTLSYDARAYYSVESTTALPRYVFVDGIPDGPLPRVIADSNRSGVPLSAVVERYDVSNYPNPFNPSTTIRFALPEPSFVRLRVFDIVGRTVAVLIEREVPPGSHAVKFDASDLPSGVYLYHIEARGYVETKKMLLLK
jgi:hypothetical protein